MARRIRKNVAGSGVGESTASESRETGIETETLTPEPEVVLSDKLAVVMCVWQRPELLTGTLRMLAAQTDQDFELWLVNNNGELREFVEKMAAENELLVPYMVLRHNDRNLGSFAKLITAHDLATKMGYEWIVLIDDDFTFGPLFLAQLRAQRRDDAIVSWRVHTLLPGRTYWDRTKTEVGKAGSYAEGTGAILPAGAVSDPAILELPPENSPADNVWMSYIAWKNGYASVQGDIQGCGLIIDNKDQYVHHVQMKVTFLQELRRRGWTV